MSLKELLSQKIENITHKNPLSENHAAVRSTLAGIIDADTPKEDFRLSAPVTLLLRNGDILNAALSYSTNPYFKKETRNPQRACLAIVLAGVEISKRSWHINPPNKLRICTVDSDSHTEPEWERNGLGAALVLESDTVMNHMLSHMEHIWGPLTFEVMITDQAFGVTKNRTGWTTHFARQMGYRQISNTEFLKLYTRI